MAQQPDGGSAKDKALQSMAAARPGFESDIRMFEQYKKEAAMRPQGEPFYTFPEWKELRQQMPHLPKLAKGGNDFSIDSMTPSARGRANFRDQPMGNQIMKETGGNWLTGSVEQGLKPLRQRAGAFNANTPEGALQEFDKVWTPEALAEHAQKNPNHTLNANRTALQHKIAINNWVDRNLTNYVKKQMATKDDPVRGLFEQGITHIPPNTLTGGHFYAQKARDNLGMPLVAQSDEGKAWENAADSHIDIHELGKLHKMFHEPWMEKAPKTTKLARTNSLEGLGFDHIVDVLKEDLAEGRIRPEQLNKISMEQAVRRAHEYNEDKKKKMAETAIKNTEGMPLVKQYDDGHKWLELAAPEMPKELPEGYKIVKDDRPKMQETPWHVVGPYGDIISSDKGLFFQTPEEAVSGATRKIGHEKLADALRYEGDTMGHCVGGYTPDVLEGRSRIFSLRDAKGEPHVTIETQPLRGAELGRYAADLPDGEDVIAMKNPPHRIVQIKGKGNGKPVAKYIPMVQDFVKSGKWSDVGDLQNTDLYKVDKNFLGNLSSFKPSKPELQHLNREQREEALVKAIESKHLPESGYVTRPDWEDAIQKHSPPKATGGTIRLAKGGSTTELDAMKLALMNKVLPQNERDANLAKFLEPSQVKDRMYHATSHDFGEFANNTRGVHFVTPSAKWANKFLSQDGGMPPDPSIMPLHVSVKNPFDYENKKHRDALAVKASIGKIGMDEIKKGKWGRIEDRTTMQAIKDLGHDGVYVKENGVKNLGVFHPHQIKSAIGNRGTYDTNEADITKAKGGTVKDYITITERPL